MSILLLVLGVLASISTLAKNEFNCSLTSIDSCTVQQAAASPPPPPRVAVHVGYEGLTGYDNPSLDGK